MRSRITRRLSPKNSCLLIYSPASKVFRATFSVAIHRYSIELDDPVFEHRRRVPEGPETPVSWRRFGTPRGFPAAKRALCPCEPNQSHGLEARNVLGTENALFEPREARGESLWSVIDWTRAVCCVEFFAHSCAIGCQIRLATHPDPIATNPQRFASCFHAEFGRFPQNVSTGDASRKAGRGSGSRE